MSARHLFDRTVLRLTGQDIRLRGNWEPPPDWSEHAAEIAFSLGIPDRALQRCGQIADVLALIPPCRDATADRKQLPLL